MWSEKWRPFCLSTHHTVVWFALIGEVECVMIGVKLMEGEWCIYASVQLANIGSDNGLSHGGRQAIFWSNAGILLIGPLRMNFSEILIKIYPFSFKKMHVKTSSGKLRSFGLGLNVLIHWRLKIDIIRSANWTSIVSCNGFFDVRSATIDVSWLSVDVLLIRPLCSFLWRK